MYIIYRIVCTIHGRRRKNGPLCRKVGRRPEKSGFCPAPPENDRMHPTRLHARSATPWEVGGSKIYLIVCTIQWRRRKNGSFFGTAGRRPAKSGRIRKIRSENPNMRVSCLVRDPPWGPKCPKMTRVIDGIICPLDPSRRAAHMHTAPRAETAAERPLKALFYKKLINYS